MATVRYHVTKLRKIPQQSQKVHPMVDNFFKMGLTNASSYDVEESFHYHLKPQLLALRIMGAFPVVFDHTGLPKFKLLSPITAYSICLYLLLNSVTWVLIKEFYTDIQKLGGNLSDSIYSVLFISLFSFTVWVPLLAWADVETTCQYLKNWTEFQAKFEAVTKTRMQLNLRRYSILSLLPIFGGILIGYFVFEWSPHADLWKMPVPMASFMYYTAFAFVKGFMFKALHKAGTALQNSFKRDLFLNPTSPNVMEDHRILWLRWSKLVSEEECMFGTLYAFALVKGLFVLVITLYCSLMDLKMGQMDLQRHINTFSPGIIGIFGMYFICRNADLLSDLGKEFRKDLEIICPSNVSSYVWLQAKLFLDTIKMNPPTVTAIGFTIVNKNLFIALMSSTVTYIIVLLQFDKGGPDPALDIPTSVTPLS